MCRQVFGFLLALVVFPFYGAICLTTCCILWFRNILVKMWELFFDLWQSFSDPGYIPEIGIGGIHARNDAMQRAAEATKNEDWKTAVTNWKHAARLYSVEAMFHLGECYENGKGIAQNLGFACECYRLAMQYKLNGGKEKYERLQRFELPKKYTRNIFEENV